MNLTKKSIPNHRSRKSIVITKLIVKLLSTWMKHWYNRETTKDSVPGTITSRKIRLVYIEQETPIYASKVHF